MKMTRYMNLLSRVAVLALLPVFAACTDEVKVPDDNTGADSNAITFSIFPESAQAGSRDTSDETDIETHISDGSMINTLYYVIYKKVGKENGEYEIDKRYNTGVNSTKFTKNEPFTLRLIPYPEDDEKVSFKILCWAQWEDENTKKNPYYDITDFPKEIRVNYDDAMNNDEARDAFYASKEFSINDKGTVVKVILERPFAQINVGTSGWDYEGIAYIQPNPQVIKYSKLKIKGLANRLSLLHDQAWYEKDDTAQDNEEELESEFAYQIIPAYRNICNDDNFGTIRGIKTIDYANGVYDSHSEEFLKISLTRPTPSGSNKDKEEGKDKEEKEKEDEFNDGFADYLGWTDYDYFCATSGSHAQLLYDIYTETFKYMSMSYVLVPFKKKETNDGFTGSTVEVSFDCAVANENGDGVGESIFADYKSVVDLKNVPANRNYRTNIIAADGTGFFMNANEINVAIYSETFADYYKRLRSTEKDWDQIDDEDDPDAVGGEINGEYGEGEDLEDEFIPEDMKYQLLPSLKNLQLKFGNENKKAGDVKRRIIDIYRYSDENVTITYDLFEGINRYSIIGDENSSEKEMFTKNDFSFDFYLGNSHLGQIPNLDLPDGIQNTIVSGTSDQYDITFNMDYLLSKIEEDNITPVVTPFVDTETEFEDYQENNKWYTRSKFVDASLKTVTRTDLPTLKYYPIEFRIKTTLKPESKRFKGGEMVVTIRLHTAYKFTFSASSNDEGLEVWNNLIKQGKPGSPDNYCKYEEYSNYIDEGAVASSSIGRISAKSRKGTGSNHRLFAIKDATMGDHLRFKGGAFVSGNEGHYITLHNLQENCGVTVKMGRDTGQDNNAKDNADPYNRALYVEWSGAQNNNPNKPEGWDWYGYNPETTGNDLLKGAKTEVKRYVFDETKIFSNYTTSFDGTKDVELYTISSGYCVYWVILSEPENN